MAQLLNIRRHVARDQRKRAGRLGFLGRGRLHLFGRFNFHGLQGLLGQQAFLADGGQGFNVIGAFIGHVHFQHGGLRQLLHGGNERKNQIRLRIRQIFGQHGIGIAGNKEITGAKIVLGGKKADVEKGFAGGKINTFYFFPGIGVAHHLHFFVFYFHQIVLGFLLNAGFGFAFGNAFKINAGRAFDDGKHRSGGRFFRRSPPRRQVYGKPAVFRRKYRRVGRGGQAQQKGNEKLSHTCSRLGTQYNLLYIISSRVRASVAAI